jgi:hypothetical protein
MKNPVTASPGKAGYTLNNQTKAGGSVSKAASMPMKSQAIIISNPYMTLRARAWKTVVL